MKVLEELLEQFKQAMLAKMIEVKPKHQTPDNPTVTDDNFPWKTYTIQSVELHLIDEIAEWIQSRTHREFQGEDIDLANLAFVHWAILKAKDASWRFHKLMESD